MEQKKSLLYVALALLMLTSCQDGGWDPYTNAYAYGNDELSETNIKTIAEVKQKYASYINTDYRDGQAYCLVDEDIKIEGVITGNDIGGNLYKQVALQDETGAIIIAINQSGLCGYLPVGQTVLVDLNGLYIGNYGLQAEIGGLYTTSSGTSMGQMSRMLWYDHFKLINPGELSEVEPQDFNISKVADVSYLSQNAGKLMRLRDVSFADADGLTVYAEGSTTNQALTGISSSDLVVRTSNYADFAAQPLPTGTLTLTGIFTQYNGTWQILLRSADDVSK